MYDNYDDQPLKLLWITRKFLLPKYLWSIWLITAFILISGSYYGFLDFSSFNLNSFVDISISGLSFALVIISAAVEIFKKDELIILLGGEPNDKINGINFLGLISPYAFTAFLYLIIGIISLIGPHVKLDFLNDYKYIFAIFYLLIVLLGLLSLFNISYMVLNDLYYAIIREKNQKNKDK